MKVFRDFGPAVQWQWQLNVTLICCLPLAQLTPFFHSQIIINLQILTPAWCLILHPNSDISNVGKQYLGCDVLDYWPNIVSRIRRLP